MGATTLEDCLRATKQANQSGLHQCHVFAKYMKDNKITFKKDAARRIASKLAANGLDGPLWGRVLRLITIAQWHLETWWEGAQCSPCANDACVNVLRARSPKRDFVSVNALEVAYNSSPEAEARRKQQNARGRNRKRKVRVWILKLGTQGWVSRTDVKGAGDGDKHHSGSESGPTAAPCG
jgi:hypothetical protein